MKFEKFKSEKVIAAIIFVAAFAYQLFCATSGFDMTDEGFLMSLYQSFGIDTATRVSGAGYPLSCYLGWLVQSIWPQGGILWTRFVGIIVVTATMLVSYLTIRKFTDSKLALVGLALQVIFLTTDPKPFGYNNLSAFIYICATSLLIFAEIKDRILPVILSGLLAGFGVYMRLPNLAFLGLCILPFAADGLRGKAFCHCAAFIAAFAAGTAAGWTLMKAIGADSLISGFFSTLGETLDGESTHKSSRMLATYIGNYIGCIKHLCILGGAILIIGLALLHKKFLWPLILIVLFILYRQYYISIEVLNSPTIMLYNGIGILGCCLAFSKDSKYNVIPAAAILFSLLSPLGSDQGFKTMWVGTWLSLPVGIVFIAKKLKDKHIRFSVAGLICLVCICVTAFLVSMRRPYYDGGSRLAKTATIKSPYARGIKTKPETARITNEVLQALYEIGVRERDTIFVFDSSPMLYYLTNTEAFDGIYWPCLQYGDQYVRTLAESAAQKPGPKAIVIQKFFNLGCGMKKWDKPSPDYTNINKDGLMATKNMKKAAFRYIHTQHYNKRWSNQYYDIYTR